MILPPVNERLLAKLTTLLENTSPAGTNIPLSCNERSGWTLYRIPSFPVPMFYADGVYCGFSGKQKVFEVEGEDLIEVKDFYFQGGPEDFYLEIKDRMGGRFELETITYIPWKGEEK